MSIVEQYVGLGLVKRNGDRIGYENREVIASLVDSALRSAGLGTVHGQAPMRDLIKPGMTVLLKPNWVLHCNMSGKGMDCMITHPVFVEEVVRQVSKASPCRIILADAPIQRAHFEELAPPTWQERLREIASPSKVEVIDLRRQIWCGSGRESHTKIGPRKASDYILFDLGAQSHLEPVSAPIGKFRNTCYDPEALKRTHSPGKHHYLLSREFFEADVVINLPKLKTHRKAGVTAALKNLVGINGDKDFLPHHRIGGSSQGGDCYEGRSFLKQGAEMFGDFANRRINSKSYYPLNEISRLFLRLNKRLFGEDELEGGWFGNNTVWRMVMDLNALALYGKLDGTISSKPQRKIYCLTDAIIAGEAFGPLAPEPISLGAVTFSASTACADLVHSALMNFDWKKIPLLLHSFDGGRYPLVSCEPEDVRVKLDGMTLTLDEVAKHGLPFRPAQGWDGHLNLAQGEGLLPLPLVQQNP